MVVYTLEQRFKILRHYFENHGNVAKLDTGFERRETSSATYVRYIREKLIHTPENIAAVCFKRHQLQFTVVLNN